MCCIFNLFVLCSMLRSLSAQFVKAKQMVKLYALSGVLGTATTLLFDICSWWCSNGASRATSWP